MGTFNVTASFPCHFERAVFAQATKEEPIVRTVNGAHVWERSSWADKTGDKIS